jgi:3-hydroxyisobutyrate dehydrogenase-like beta-hydroxyacid dehydrogenase
MYRISMIGLGKMGLPIAHNLMERSFEIPCPRRRGSQDLAAAGPVHDQVSDVSALSPGERS